MIVWDILLMDVNLRALKWSSEVGVYMEITFGIAGKKVGKNYQSMTAWDLLCIFESFQSETLFYLSSA